MHSPTGIAFPHGDKQTRKLQSRLQDPSREWVWRLFVESDARGHPELSRFQA